MHLALADQHLVGDGLDQASDTNKRTECGVRRISAVDLDYAHQRMALGIDHRPAQLARQHPGRPIRAQPQHRLELQRRDAIGMRRHQKCRQEPRPQRQLAGMHDRPGRHRGLTIASNALEGLGLALQGPSPICATSRTDKPLRPAQLIQVGGTGSLIREPLLKLNQ